MKQITKPNPKKKRLPNFIERISDGEIFVRNEDETYSLHNDMMATPYKWTYDRLLNDRRCNGDFRNFRGVDLDALVLDARRQIRRGKDYGLFALQRRLELRQPTDLGKYLYSQSPDLKKVFDQYIPDEDIPKFNFGGFNYVILREGFWGPNKEKSSSQTWADNIRDTLVGKKPNNLVFYLRQDPKKISARIIIPTPDFYGGLTRQEAIREYGSDIHAKMIKHLGAITISRDLDGKTRVPFSDLNYAFRKATGQRTNPEMWD